MGIKGMQPYRRDLKTQSVLAFYAYPGTWSAKSITEYYHPQAHMAVNAWDQCEPGANYSDSNDHYWGFLVSLANSNIPVTSFSVSRPKRFLNIKGWCTSFYQ